MGERFIAGPYGVAHHYDGSNYCFLVTRSGQQTTTNRSGIRPFHVNLALGQVGMGRRPCGQGRAACRQPHAVRPVQRCRAGRLLQPGAVVAFRGSVGRARTAATYGFHLQWTDTNLYQNIHCVGGNANSACFLFDYAVQDNLPSACTILGIDPGGNGTTSRQFVNNGVPGPDARPNCFKGVGEIRGRQPSIANLRPDLPQVVTALDLAGPSRQTQPITNSPLFTPCEDGLHRTSVYLRVNRGRGAAPSLRASPRSTGRAH